MHAAAAVASRNRSTTCILVFAAGAAHRALGFATGSTMPSARTAILGSVAVIATGVGVILLVRRLQRPALEKIAGGKKKRKPSLTRAKSVLRESRRKSDEPTEYAAFVSHMKAEASMEARFVQGELETAFGQRIFLDSDDLRTLSDLTTHVRESDVLVLVQSKSVLTRPYCLLELLTACQHGVPIVGVCLSKHSFPYDFDEVNLTLTLTLTSNPYPLTPNL